MSISITDERFIETKPCRYGMISYFKTDLIIGRSLSHYGEWAQSEIDFLLKFVNSGDTIIDAGAFVGTHTLAFARKVGPSGKVYAFEPHPITFEILKQNVFQNDLTNVLLFNIALSDTIGTNRVKRFDAFTSDNPGMFSVVDELAESLSLEETFFIETTLLDKFSFNKCNLLKLDIEGAEYNALNGAKETLRRFRPLVFTECLSADSGWKIVELMRTEGFRPFLHNVESFNPTNYRNNQKNFFSDARETNLFFIPEEKVLMLENQIRHFKDLIPICSLDDLVLGLLKKPQYKYEVLDKTVAAKVVGVRFWANETEVKQFNTREQNFTKKLKELEDNYHELKKRLAEKEQEVQALTAKVVEKEQLLTVLQIELAKQKEELGQKSYEVYSLQKQLIEKNNEIQLIRSSVGWYFIERYRRLIDKLFPVNTKRRHVFELGQRALKNFITKKRR